MWRLKPDAYNADAADGAKGGTLYPCLPSPPMLETDSDGHCWVAQASCRPEPHRGAGLLTRVGVRRIV